MNIYVSNVSFHTAESDLNNLFSRFGTVSSVKLIIDKLTGKARGFGFIEMPSEEEGRNAIKHLNNKEIEGRLLGVSIAKIKEAVSERYSSPAKQARRW